LGRKIRTTPPYGHPSLEKEEEFVKRTHLPKVSLPSEGFREKYNRKIIMYFYINQHKEYYEYQRVYRN
jgi:hypothetical protein